MVAATVAGCVFGILIVPVPSLICLVAAAIQARNAMQEVMFSAWSVTCPPAGKLRGLPVTSASSPCRAGGSAS
jgi:hypothetical protein